MAKEKPRARLWSRVRRLGNPLAGEAGRAHPGAGLAAGRTVRHLHAVSEGGERRDQRDGHTGGGAVGVETLAGMYEQLAQEGCGETLRGLRKMLADGEPAVAVWGQMASAVEAAAGVLAFLRRRLRGRGARAASWRRRRTRWWRSRGGSKRPPTAPTCNRATPLSPTSVERGCVAAAAITLDMQC